MTTLRLAGRNLLRSPRRTVLTGVAIVAGVAISVIGQGFVDGAVESIIVAATDGTVGHVQARPKNYPTLGQQYPVDELLQLPPATLAMLDGQTEGWTTRTYFAPTAAHGNRALRVTAIGYDPSRDDQVFPRGRWKLEGRMPGANERALLVTPRVAGLLKVKPGDEIVLQTRTHKGAINALELPIAGVVRTGNVAIDAWSVLLPQATVTELIASPLPTHLSVRLADRDAAPEFAAALGSALGAQAETVTWQSETEELLRLQEVRRKSLNFIVFILMALAAFGIANTILMAAHERVREIGTLRSMGMTEGGVLRLFLTEGAILGLVGGLLGALAGGGLVSYWATHPLDLGGILEKQKVTFSMTTLIYGQPSLATAAMGVLVGVVVAVLASIYPARVAARMVPADAVRAS